MMFDNFIIPSTTIVGYNRRLSIVIIFLASLAVLLVVTSVAAFVYITRKEKVLRRSHLLSVIIIIFVELAFLIAVVSCCSIQSKNTQGQILAALLIVISFLALMTLIYFLLEDVLKERIQPYPDNTTGSKSFTVQTQSVSRHASPIPPPPPRPPPRPPPSLPPSPPPPADDTAIPIPTPPVLTPLPRIPTPPLPCASPPPEKPLSPFEERPVSPSLEKPVSPSLEKPVSPLLEKPSTPSSEKRVTPSPEPSIHRIPESPPPYITNYEKIRRELMGAIEERTIPALEEAIQQVKDHDYIQQLKYECERALELLNRLMKIEHMKIKVLRLNQSTIAELHSYTKPPDEVSTVMRATFLLLGHSEREIQDWLQIQNLLGRFGKESIRRRCYELNPLSIPVDKAREAKEILRNYDLLRVNEISVGLAAFFNWAVTMVEEREKLLESQRRIVR